MGVNNTLYQVKDLWWPNIENEIREYILTCDICQKRRKNKEKVTHEKSETPTKPFQHIGIDVMGPLPRMGTNKRYIILVIDWLTK